MSSGFDPVRFMEEGMESGLAPDPFDPRREQALAELYAQSQSGGMGEPQIGASVPMAEGPQAFKQPPALGQILLRMLSGMQITPGRSASPLAKTLAGLGSGVAQATGQTLLRRQGERYTVSERERIRRAQEVQRNRLATDKLNEENRKYGRESAGSLRAHQLNMIRDAADRKSPKSLAQIEAESAAQARGSAAGNPAAGAREERAIAAHERSAQNSTIQATNSLVDDYRLAPAIKGYQAVRSNLITAEAGAKQNSGPGDIALVFSFMRAMEPENVNSVREGEYDNARSAAGLFQKYKNLPSQYFKGNQLTVTGRQFFLGTMKAALDARRPDYDSVNTQYKRRAAAYGVDPTLFVQEHPADSSITSRGWFEQNAPGGR